jgi:prepilin-type N-terminal cleavage/methylation domain-containing protein
MSMRIGLGITHRKTSLHRGFTLAETMVVLVILAMLITLAIPRMDTSRYRADAVAHIVRTSLQNASRTAITRQHDMIVSFDTLGDRISIVYDANNNGIAETGERVTTRGLETGVLFADPSIPGIGGGQIVSAVEGPSIAMKNGMPSVTFHRDGSTSSDAEIYVSIAARGPKFYRAVTVIQSTGRVEWYRLNTTSNQWVLAGS